MSSDNEISNRIPSLVQYCQRVAIQHVDSISSFGDHLRYELIKPILDHCTAEALVRLEDASPHLQLYTPEIWKDMCIRSFPLVMEQFSEDCDELESWRQEYFALRAAEARRLEELGSRLRAKRLMADSEKKEREIKITTKLPLAKRPRTGWSSNPQPKTLFQKTRMEASRIHKSIYSPFKASRAQGAKDYRVLHNTKAPSPPCTKLPQRVTVNTICLRDSSTSSCTSSATSPSSSPAPFRARTSLRYSPAKSPVVIQPTRTIAPSISTSTKPGKKDPMAALFMPKHRAHSQLPDAITSIVSR